MTAESGNRNRSSPAVTPLGAETLRWRCPDAWLPFETTEEVAPRLGIELQDTAIEALNFGLRCRGQGQNIYARGLRGGTRLKLVAELVRRTGGRKCEVSEYAYVHNFASPKNPRLLTLAGGQGQVFQRRIRELIDFILNRLPDALKSSDVKTRVEEVRAAEQATVARASEELKESLTKAGLELVSVTENGVDRPAVRPVIDGQPVTLEKLAELLGKGEIDEATHDRLSQAVQEYEPKARDVIARVGLVFRQSAAKQRELTEGPARWVLDEATKEIRAEFPSPDVQAFLDGITSDVVENRLRGSAVEPFDAAGIYGVHLLEDWSDREPFPVIIENHPTLLNLVGSVEASDPASAHAAIQAGSVLRANGGCLIVDASELRSESNSWKVLARTLSSGLLEIFPPELTSSSQLPPLKPAPIPIDVRVILVGDAKTFDELDRNEDAFSDLFKVLADFDSTIERTEKGAELYAGVLSRLAEERELRPFDSSAVAAMVEEGARLAQRADRLTAHFGKIGDTAREAAYLAESAGEDVVTRPRVEGAIRKARHRADLPARRYRTLLEAGTFNVETTGWEVGQINGLAVMKAGQIAYGFPARLTVSAGPGDQGIIDIESRASLSGRIHTKGMQILDGLVRYLLRADFPLTFTASVTFEQSYGNIDGDSASGAEVCCVLSALADAPILQGFAMTGAIDQRGRIQAVGGVNEKVEGFFDVCADGGLTGEQGVLIPRANVGDLMLRDDVIEECRKENFRVIAVDWVHEALEVLTAVPAGTWEDNGGFTPGSVLNRARERARTYWLQSTRRVRHSIFEEEQSDIEGQGSDR